MRIAAIICDLYPFWRKSPCMPVCFPSVIRFPDNRHCEFFQPCYIRIGYSLSVLFLHQKVSVQGCGWSVLCRYPVRNQRIFLTFPYKICYVECPAYLAVEQITLHCCPVQCFFLFRRGIVIHPENRISCQRGYACYSSCYYKFRNLILCQPYRLMPALRRMDKSAVYLACNAYFMNIKSVFVFFVIECQLVRAAAVICRGIASEPLRFVYVAEASKRYSYCIYCLWKYHHILSRKKCLSIIRFAPGHRVVRCQYARLFPVKLCRLSCDNSVDQRGGILIFSFCVCIRHKHPQPPFVESRHSQYLYFPIPRTQRINLWGSVNMQIL